MYNYHNTKASQSTIIPRIVKTKYILQKCMANMKSKKISVKYITFNP